MAEDGEYLTTKYMSSSILAAPPRPRSNAALAFMPLGTTLKDKVESLEKQVLNEALDRHRWNQSRAANELGLSRRSLARRVATVMDNRNLLCADAAGLIPPSLPRKHPAS
ncbi:helix-turn-helix domain-containing protein [Bradyrhizobium sp. RT4b]|uniref:helix-turn-helix domain-containing protein n=1 Tax=Bradyrhizobium sp. RT4b TaxID=3156379 RepID=UPI003391F62D